MYPLSDAELAGRIADLAGRALMELRRTSKLTGPALGRAGDELANRLILSALGDARPEDCILSEEAADASDRCTSQRVWIIDPLDGTREFEAGRDDWAVHVGLAVDGTAAAGAVALPVQGRVLDSDSVRVPPPLIGPLTIVVSRSRAPELCHTIAERIGARLIPMGSAGAKVMAVVDGRAHAYLHTGGQFEWDNCAPVAVARAAGLHASRVDGGELRYNRPDPSLPDLLVCRPELAVELLAAVRSCG